MSEPCIERGGVELRTEGTDKCVEPLGRLGHGRREFLGTRAVHIKSDGLHLLFETPGGSPSEEGASKADGAEDSRSDEEGKPAAGKGDEEPDDERGKHGKKREPVEVEQDRGK